MKGTVLFVEADKALVIRGEDDQKYQAAAAVVKSELTARVGDAVDFDVAEGQVQEVYILRNSSTVEEVASKAKAMAGEMLNTLRANANSENMHKAKAAVQAQSHKMAEQLKAVDYSQINTAMSKFQLHNLFGAVAFLVLLVSLFLPMASNQWIGHVSYAKALDGVTLQVCLLLLTGVGFVFGAPKPIARIVGWVALASVVYPLIDGYVQLNDQLSQMKQLGFGNFSNSIVKTVTDSMSWGAGVLLVGLVLAVIALLRGKYQHNAIFAPAVNTEPAKQAE